MTFEELAKKVALLESVVGRITGNQRDQIKLPLDDTSQRIIKEAVGSSVAGIDLVENGTFTADKTISDLDGDTNSAYKLIVIANYTTAFDMAFQVNADTGTNYEYLRHYSTKQGAGAPATGTDFTTSAVSIKTSFITQKNYICELNISAVSGKKRILSANCVGIDGAASYYDTVNTLGVWTNTTDNLTSVTIKTGTVTAGEYFLYKLK